MDAAKAVDYLQVWPLPLLKRMLQLATSFSRCKVLIGAFRLKDFLKLDQPAISQFAALLLETALDEHVARSRGDGFSVTAAMDMVLPSVRFALSLPTIIPQTLEAKCVDLLRRLPTTDVLDWVGSLAADELVGAPQLMDACDLARLRVPAGLVAFRLALAGRAGAPMYDSMITKRTDVMLPDFMLLQPGESREQHAFLLSQICTMERGLFHNIRGTRCERKPMGFLFDSHTRKRRSLGLAGIQVFMPPDSSVVLVRNLPSETVHYIFCFFFVGNSPFTIVHPPVQTSSPPSNVQFSVPENVSFVYIVTLPLEYVNLST